MNIGAFFRDLILLALTWVGIGLVVILGPVVFGLVP